MTRILHISDLHFGRIRPGLAHTLIALAGELAPDLIAVSGDLTQRARRGEYRMAHAFLSRLPAPWLAVPGNHDVSLDNLWLRFVQPWDRWRHWIGPDLAPATRVGGVSVIGLNTVNRFAWQSGRIGRSARARIAAAAGHQGPLVVVMHHPLEHPPGHLRTPMRGVEGGIAALHAAGADIVLSGHLHVAHAAPLGLRPGILLVQAGSGLSTRLGAQTNSVNLLTLGGDRVRVDRYEAAPDGRFAVAGSAAFRRSAAVWRPVPVGLAVAAPVSARRAPRSGRPATG